MQAEHHDLRIALRRFFEQRAPRELIERHDRDEEFPRAILESFVEMDLWGYGISETYGGVLADELSRCIAAEEMQRAGACLSYAYLPTALFCAPAIERHGSDDQRRALLPEIAGGRLRIAMGLTEPDSGSDLMSLTTRARPDGSDWVIRGQKVFTTGADTCQYILTLVRTEPEARPSRGLSVLLVPTDAPGLTVRPLRKLAGQATHTCEVFFDDVRVPGTALVGARGQGAAIMLGQLDSDRLYTAAQSLGIAQGAFDLALGWARQRVQFGRPIIEHQAIGHMLADLHMRIEAARAITERAAAALTTGASSAGADAAMAKVMASEAAMRTVTDGMQILGGASYIVETGMEHYYREAKIQEIFAGTNQILRNIIAKQLQEG